MITADIINQLNYGIFFPVIDHSLIFSAPDLSKFYLLLCQPANTTGQHFLLNQPIKQKSEYLLSHPLTLNYINQISHSNQTKVAIMPFKSSTKIELLAEKHGWLVLANPRQLNLTLEDKISFAKICQENSINTIPHLITTYTSKNLTQAKNEFSTDKLVIQTKTGWAGNSTFLYQSPSQLPQGSLVKIMPFICGHTITVNGCIINQIPIFSPPANQLNNPQHTANIFATTGRSWPARLSSNQKTQVKQICSQAGKLLVKLGYRGFFGLDLMIDHNQAYLIECNPRLTASFDFYTKLEHKYKLEPLVYLHILSFFSSVKLSPEIIQDRFNFTQITGSQITIRNDQDKISQVINNL